MMNAGKSYLIDIWNYAYWATNLLAILICIQHSTQYFESIDRTTLIKLTSIEILL